MPTRAWRVASISARSCSWCEECWQLFSIIHIGQGTQGWGEACPNSSSFAMTIIPLVTQHFRTPCTQRWVTAPRYLRAAGTTARLEPDCFGFESTGLNACTCRMQFSSRARCRLLLLGPSKPEQVRHPKLGRRDPSGDHKLQPNHP